ncbi:MAG: hypothetical protein A2Y17_01975 [Clostridiales bacterium GWF2_38_85]|nr:MAG: hypothetical protein A2Y17_01975 [Clostridiales bacterium GWF2_38_85]HBL85334.1 hypothetical protein [Clostridiales bacterium]
MVYGAIDEKSEKGYTCLKRVFGAIQNKQIDYNWLLTYVDCYPQNPIFDELLNKEYCWLSGDELTSIVQKEDFQWVWAVLSGFDKDIPLLEVLIKYKLPYADGYKGFWEDPISIQHPLASIEIVPWDSSFVLIFSKQKEIVDNFMKAFPLSEDMELYNTKWKNI